MFEYARFQHGDIPFPALDGREHVPDLADAEGHAWREAIDETDGCHGLDPVLSDDGTASVDLGDILHSLGRGGVGKATHEDDEADDALAREAVHEAFRHTASPFPGTVMAYPATVSWRTVPECELLMHTFARRFADSVRPVIVHLYGELHAAMRQENLSRSMTCMPQVELPSLSAFARQIGR